MSENSKIEWTDHTFNPWIGCTKVSPACDHCYAEISTASRSLKVSWGAGQPRHRTGKDNWNQPKRWNDNHDNFFTEHGRRQRVFCASLADVFDNEVPAAWRVDLVELIAATPNLDWLILTKRIGNAHTMWPAEPLPNVWLGATICNQEEADRDIPKLLQVPVCVRFLSMEPLLGPVDLTKIPIPGSGHGYHEFDPIITMNVLRRASVFASHVHWVIVGGESGPNARPMQTQWVKNLRDQCIGAGVPFFFKQWGEWLGALQDGNPEAGTWELNLTNEPQRVGKKAAGRLLDGQTWEQFPQSNKVSA